MRTYLLGIFILFACAAKGQRTCASEVYLEYQKTIPGFSQRFLDAENFILQQQSKAKVLGDNFSDATPVIRIPVVVHILFQSADQNIPDERILSQLEVINRDFRRQNADTTLTPERFKAVAADVQIEFYLATVDPAGRPTTGIIRKQTAVASFKADDKIKFDEWGGSDAWDNNSYFNIWVGNLQSIIGYSSVPGTEAARDGIVIATSVFGLTAHSSPYNLGRTAVHETGHWLGLKHIWGDHYCGNDFVDDTPNQGNFTPGCPSGFRTSCSNGSTGDMYMNYMDYTSDACVNMFTNGQKQRMRAVFATGGPRQALLTSRGLDQPWNFTPPEPGPEKNLIVKIFPSPATSEISLNLSPEWIGKQLRIYDSFGNLVSVKMISSQLQKIDVRNFRAGLYFVAGENGSASFREKFVRL